MSCTLERILQLIEAGDLKISEHGYDEIAEEGLLVRDILSHVSEAVMVEDYPDYPRGPHVCYCCRKIFWECRCMRYGGFQRELLDPPF